MNNKIHIEFYSNRGEENQKVRVIVGKGEGMCIFEREKMSKREAGECFRLSRLKRAGRQDRRWCLPVMYFPRYPFPVIKIEEIISGLSTEHLQMKSALLRSIY